MTFSDFLLNTETAKSLYIEVKDLPIIDYHNHLSISDISVNKRFSDVYDMWVAPDPYKHRAMRMCGVEERYITGDANNEEKFAAWCATLPKLTLNPLSHWSAMELKTVFGVEDRPCEENAKSIYERCNGYLGSHNVTVSFLLDLFGVERACPCLPLTGDTSVFGGDPRITPSLRGDDAVSLSPEFTEKLGAAENKEIKTLSDFETALENRLIAFKKVGCVFSDHALDNGFVFYADDGKNGERFSDLINGKIDAVDRAKLSSYVLATLGKLYSKHKLVMQLHIGAERYTSSVLRAAVGAAGGFAGIGEVNVRALTMLLDEIDRSAYGLPKTVLFTLNPSDDATVSVLSGSYSKGGVGGLITQGPAWWWCDHKFGIRNMLENASAFGVLSNFVGMTTDSRSFLSFVRHDYFRRILCSWLGEKYDGGETSCDFEGLKSLAFSLCYQNAKNAMETGERQC